MNAKKTAQISLLLSLKIFIVHSNRVCYQFTSDIFKSLCMMNKRLQLISITSKMESRL